MNVWPLRFREIDSQRLFFADDTGRYFISDRAFLDRYAHDQLTTDDKTFLIRNGHAFNQPDDPEHTAFAWRWTARQNAQNALSYIILIPTLRCNLSCTYCQVSRAPQGAKGFDWTEETLSSVLRFLDGLEATAPKIEFQGGEPLLRLDILEQVRAFCRTRFDKPEFVVCTNLQELGDRQLAFLSDDDTFTSTSLDGPLADHNKRRTQNYHLAGAFYHNLERLIQLNGLSRVSALPTLDIDDLPDIDTLINAYASFGFSSIYLRPVNYQGFARRRSPRADDLERWNSFHAAFVRRLIERNAISNSFFEEFYFSHCLRRVLGPNRDGHADLRNPSLPASDYLVVDFDGRLYPSDEARMLTRVGKINLSIGSVEAGLLEPQVDAIRPWGTNNFDPDCVHCPYQPYCGSDPVDDVSRYGRLDVPRLGTWFCGRQIAIFDLIVGLIFSNDQGVTRSLAHWAGLAAWPPQLAQVHQ